MRHYIGETKPLGVTKDQREKGERGYTRERQWKKENGRNLVPGLWQVTRLLRRGIQQKRHGRKDSGVEVQTGCGARSGSH